MKGGRRGPVTGALRLFTKLSSAQLKARMLAVDGTRVVRLRNGWAVAGETATTKLGHDVRLYGALSSSVWSREIDYADL